MESALDTIAAIASPPGASARGIVRVSGPRAFEIACACCELADGGELARDVRCALEAAPRGLSRVRFDDGRGTQRALLLWMRAPRSFTGDDVVELHVCGNPHLLRIGLERVLALGARIAGPGEFTRRAFLAGKLDLTRAQGVLLLVEAHDEAERRDASALLAGGLAHAVERARDALEDLRALCEASLDFDESDTGHVPVEELDALAFAARDELSRALGDLSVRPSESALARIVLLGEPNAGKSRLFNALCGARALVSPAAGTTRDPLRATLELGATQIELVDTAGIERAPLERHGSDGGGDTLGTPARDGDDLSHAAQERTREALASAELALWVVDASRAGSQPPLDLPELAAGSARLLIWNQIDRADAAAVPPSGWSSDPRFAGWLALSAARGDGVEALRGELARRASGARARLAREVAERHRAALIAALAALERVRAALTAHTPLELAAEHARRATAALDDVLGTTTAEDVLDRIFARFCIGK